MYQKYCSYNDWILLWVSFEPTLLSEVAGDRSPDSTGWISANASTSPDWKGKDNYPRRLQLLAAHSTDSNAGTVGLDQAASNSSAPLTSNESNPVLQHVGSSP
jgi:hypothetical protein